MRRRVFATAGVAGIGALTAVAALAIGTTTGFAATTTSSAYGIAAEGPIPIEPTPYVESTDGTEKSSTALELPEEAAPLITLEVAKVTAGDDKASVQLVNTAIGNGPVPEELQGILDQFADALKPICEQDPPPIPLPPELAEQLDPAKLCQNLTAPPALLKLGLIEVYCEDGKGGVDIADVTLLGQEIDIPEVPPNSGGPENPLLNITMNKQVKGDDGSLSVTGLEINIGGEEGETISLGNATCGKGEKVDTPTATPQPPVTTGLPVTG